MVEKTKERRINQTISEDDMYKAQNLNDFIKKERRKDELSMLKEVRSQKRTWLVTLIFCFLLNVGLILISFTGGN